MPASRACVLNLGSGCEQNEALLYAITDIETTGSYASGHSITEICVALTNGNAIVDRFHTLLNPGSRLSPSIVALTGITDDMLKDAPSFEDIADELYDFLKDSVFVAHNVSFDFSFIKAGFDELGYQWNPRKLCTVKLARKAFPGHASYSLDNITRELQIVNERAHRAYGDVAATYQLFLKCLDRLSKEELDKMCGRSHIESFLPLHIEKKQYDQLPEKPGVYYFLDEKGKPLYIGKAINIKKRVKTHFTTGLSLQKTQAFISKIKYIDHVVTGSEMLAFLLEDSEIRKHWPHYNKAQKSRPNRFSVMLYEDQRGYQRLMVTRNSGAGAIKQFTSHNEALCWLVHLATTFELDQRLLGLDNLLQTNPMPSVSAHNERLRNAIAIPSSISGRLMVAGNGRTTSERSFVAVENERVIGYGFIPTDAQVSEFDTLKDYMQPIMHSEVSATVLSNYLKNPKGHKVIYFDDKSLEHEF